MGIIVCQECEDVLEYIESEKVHVLYAKCTSCHTEKKTEETIS
nr:GapA-binding peptide SR1P [Risungbinella massiliensis]